MVISESENMEILLLCTSSVAYSQLRLSLDQMTPCCCFV
jgi:hypothetical protein